MKLAIVGSGRMGSAFATAFATRTSHAVVVRGSHAKSGSAAELVRELGITRADDKALLSADVIFVAVPPFAETIHKPPWSDRTMFLPSGDGTADMFVPSCISTVICLVGPCRRFWFSVPPKLASSSAREYAAPPASAAHASSDIRRTGMDEALRGGR